MIENGQNSTPLLHKVTPLNSTAGKVELQTIFCNFIVWHTWEWTCMDMDMDLRARGHGLAWTWTWTGLPQSHCASNFPIQLLSFGNLIPNLTPQGVDQTRCKEKVDPNQANPKSTP